MYCGNQSALKLIFNPEFHKRTKHIDIKYHFIRDHQECGHVNFDYVQTDLQIANIFTKALPTDKFNKFRFLLGLSQEKQV